MLNSFPNESKTHIMNQIQFHSLIWEVYEQDRQSFWDILLFVAIDLKFIHFLPQFDRDYSELTRITIALHSLVFFVDRWRAIY